MLYYITECLWLVWPAVSFSKLTHTFDNLSAMCSLPYTHIQLSTCAQTIIHKHSVHIYTHTLAFTRSYMHAFKHKRF